jgi:hypothetical protein
VSPIIFENVTQFLERFTLFTCIRDGICISPGSDCNHKFVGRPLLSEKMSPMALSDFNHKFVGSNFKTPDSNSKNSDKLTD